MADSHIYKQAGNSVTVTVIERIANNIVKVLKEFDSEDIDEVALDKE